jgi:hypothetical protein
MRQRRPDLGVPVIRKNYVTTDQSEKRKETTLTAFVPECFMAFHLPPECSIRCIGQQRREAITGAVASVKADLMSHTICSSRCAARRPIPGGLALA